ncbi:MAG: L-threonylcarbamoyladenylate synthase [archaeon]
MNLKINEVNSNIIPILLKSIFIYPTDTIYGLGCNAENKQLVEKIREIKKRDNNPFSIIVPSINYILKNFETTEKEIKKFLPGPYTLILKKKDKNSLTHLSDTDYIGIRIPSHPLTKFLQQTGKPIVTTSVNISGQKHASKIKEIDSAILNKVDLIIDGGTLHGKPSTLIKNGKEINR